MSSGSTIRVLGLAVLVRTGLAGAEAPPGETAAQAVFEQGRDAMRRGAYAEACPRFSESQRLDPSNGTLLNLILCQEKLGKVASAWSHAQELVDRLPADDPRKEIAERRLATLSPRVPRLNVKLSPAAPGDIKILLDDAELDAAGLHGPIPIDPGIHHLLVKAPNRADRRIELSIEEGRTYEWLAEPGPELAPEQRLPPPTTAHAALAPSSPSKSSTTRRSRAPVPAADRTDPSGPPKWLGWTAGGVGVAGLAAGSVMVAMVLDRKATVEEICPDKTCQNSSAYDAGLDAAEEGKRLQIAAMATIAVGVAGIGFGIYALTRSDTGGQVGSRASIVATSSTVLIDYGGAF